MCQLPRQLLKQMDEWSGMGEKRRVLDVPAFMQLFRTMEQAVAEGNSSAVASDHANPSDPVDCP